MKKTIIILFLFICSLSFGQVCSINQGGTTTNIGGTLHVTNELFYAMPHAIGRFIYLSMGTGNYGSRNYMWYRTCLANDKISFRIANLSGSRAITVADFKVYVKKQPEN